MSLREKKPADALRELEQVISPRLTLKAASLRVSAYTAMGKVSEAIQYAERILYEDATGNTEEVDEGKAEDYADLSGEYANAVWMQGDAERALALAWQAVAIWNQQETAQWLIREIENKRSDRARYHALMIEGVWPEAFEGEDSPSGFFVTYGVVADSPDEAFTMAIRFEPADIRESLHIHECEVSPEWNDNPKGVYYISNYHCFPVEASHE